MLKKIVSVLFWILAALTLFTTLAPLGGSQEWWIRCWDFPRIHIAIVALFTVVMGFLIMRKSIAVVVTLLVLCASYQAYRIFPYTQWATEEIVLKSNVAENEQISLISANVLMGNTDHASVIVMIEREQPDVLFLMETDRVWDEALASTLENYSTVLSYPCDNHYGLIFATNLRVTASEIVFLSDDETPTVLADLIGPTGNFFFVGLHPRPPVPGVDTDERDEQIKRAALLADREISPVVAMGDFNDVAWSWTSERFKEYGEFRDPRVGRGMIPSFDVTSWWMRFPIDQLYITDGLGLVSFSRLGPVGSDHFPMKAIVTVQ